MFCKKYKKQVFVDDCEKCLTQRKADPVCFKRGFIWGNCGAQPRWAFPYEEAEKRDIDVSMYYDPNWEGNSHLRKKIQQGKRKEKRFTKRPIPTDIRWAVWERDNFTCQTPFCGARKYLTIDHIYPESKGGKIELSNLQTLCKSCNSKKGNRSAKA